MKLLIVYGTTEGQTRKIARFMEDEAQQLGARATLCNSTDEPLPPTDFDRVIIAASMHTGKYQESVKHYIQEHAEALNTTESYFVSVSLSATGVELAGEKELHNITEKFLDELDWKPTTVEYVAGALRYSKYNWLKTFVMRMIAEKAGHATNTDEDHEYTDWDQVKQFVMKITK